MKQQLKKIFLISTLFFSSSLLLKTFSSSPIFKKIKPLPIKPDVYQITNGKKRLRLQIHENIGIDRINEPIRGSIPFPEGELLNLKHFRLVDGDGEEISVQLRVMSRWWNFDDPSINKSIKWLNLSFQTSIKSHQIKYFYCEYGSGVQSRLPQKKMISKNRDSIIINTGKLKVTFDSLGILQQIEKNIQNKWIPQLKSSAKLFCHIRSIKLPKVDQWKTIQNLDGQNSWKFKPEDKKINQELSWNSLSYDDKHWSSVDPFYCWKNQGFPKHYGYGWYRKNIKLTNNNLERDLYLELRHMRKYKPAAKYWIYLNERLIEFMIGERFTKGQSMGRQPRIILPKKYLKEGQNLIAIRCFDDQDSMGGLVCTPLIVSPHNNSLDGPWPNQSGLYSQKDGEVRIMSNDSERAVLSIKGKLSKNKEQMTSFNLIYSFYKNSEKIDISHTFKSLENPAEIRYLSVGIAFPLIAKSDSIQFASEDESKEGLQIKNFHEKTIRITQFHNGTYRYPGYPNLKANPYHPKYRITSDQDVIHQGKNALGILSLNHPHGQIKLLMRDFKQHYPSELEYESKTNTLRAYMWPKSEGEMDLRTWSERKDGQWKQLTKDANSGHINAKKIKGIFSKEKHHIDKITRFSRMGASWTRKIRLDFSHHKNTYQNIKDVALSWQYPIRPFVSNRYNCQTVATGFPARAYDFDQFPYIETFRNYLLLSILKAHEDWLQVYGMWYRGALRYKFETDNPLSRSIFKLNWNRRWFGQESAKSPSNIFLLEYLRTGYEKYFNYGQTIAYYAMNCIYRTEHPIPRIIGYAGKHSAEPYSRGNDTSHTNLDGMALYYLLSGDETYQIFFETLANIYSQESIESFSYTKDLSRNNDGPLFARVVLWNLFGKPWIKDWLDKSLEFYEKNDQEGFNGLGGSTYRKRLMMRAWYLTRSQRFLKLMGGEPNPTLSFFSKGNVSGLFQTYLQDELNARTALKRSSLSPMNIHSLEKTLKAKHLDRKNSFFHYLAPHGRTESSSSTLIKALEVAQFPSIDPNTDFSKYFKDQYRNHKKTEIAVNENKHIIPIDLHGLYNANPDEVESLHQLPLSGPKRAFGLYHTINDTAPKFKKELEEGAIGWDFGLPNHTENGWINVYGRALWPSFAGYAQSKSFIGFPFGAQAFFAGIPFQLFSENTNNNHTIIKINNGQSKRISIDKKVSRLFFLGHVITGILDMSQKVGAKYILHYEDGTKTYFDLKPGIHYDEHLNTISAATACKKIPYARPWARTITGQGGLLHVNLFELQCNSQKVLKQLEIQSYSEGFTLIGLSAEVNGKPIKEKTVKALSKTECEHISPNKSFEVQLPKGWYDLHLSLRSLRSASQGYLQDAQMFITAGDHLVTGGFLSRYAENLTIPIYVKKNKINICIYINNMPRNNKSIVKYCYFTKKTTLSSPQQKELPTMLPFGFTKDLKDKGRLQHEGYLDHPEKDGVIGDWFDVYNNNFRASVPNGLFLLEAYLFTPAQQPGYFIKANGVKSKEIRLPAQTLLKGTKRMTQSYSTLKIPLNIENNSLYVKFPKSFSGPHFAKVGLRALKLKPISKTVYEKLAITQNSHTTVKKNKTKDWTLVFEENFDREKLGNDWFVANGNWMLIDQSLYGNKGMLISSNNFHGDQRIEFECWSSKPGDISAVLKCGWSGINSGCFFGFGSNNNSMSKILIEGRQVMTGNATIIKNKKHKVVCEVVNQKLRYWVDEKEVGNYDLKKKMEGAHIGFYIYKEGMIDNLKVYTK